MPPTAIILGGAPRFHISARFAACIDDTARWHKRLLCEKVNPVEILDLLYCEVLFDDWEKNAQCMVLSAKREQSMMSCEKWKIVRTRDSFASVQAGVRCAEMVVKINHYLATIRFREASLTKLENQVDDVHHLAEQVGLVTGSLQVDPLLMSGRPAQQSRLVVGVVALLRISSLLAAVYLGGQYFVRYSPPFIRSKLPQLIRDAFALKQTVEPSDGTLPEGITSNSGRMVGGEPFAAVAFHCFLFAIPGLDHRPLERLAPVSVSQSQVETVETHPAALRGVFWH